MNQYDLWNNLKLPATRYVYWGVGAILISLILLVEDGTKIALVGLIILLCVLFYFIHFVFSQMVSTKDDYTQLTSYIQLHERVGGAVLLPSSRGYAASPDFVNFVLDTITAHQPKKIVEASCGLSTIAISEYLLRQGQTDVVHIALEHDDYYRQQCLTKVRNTSSFIAHTPIITHKLNSKTWKWYDISKVDNLEGIDMLIVDGPPAYLQSDSRYPALPILVDKLNDGAIIIMDDAARGQEKRVVAKWSKEYGLSSSFHFAEKGISTLKYSR